MNVDYYVLVAGDKNFKEPCRLPEGLAWGFVDEVSVRFFQDDKEKARGRYMKCAGQEFKIPCSIQSATPNFSSLPSPNWLGLQVEFELLTPWYSKDERVFHVMDNPVRKDRVFGVPFMSASSWKGLIRWACRMQAGLQEQLEAGKRFDEWQDPHWIIHLFGKEKGEEKEFHQGAIVLYPTWFNKIGFEVINPHSRAKRAGTQPIYYEVVPGRRPKPGNSNECEEGGKGSLYLLYAPWPDMKLSADPREIIPKLLQAIEMLLTQYGISAKRTVGWGTAHIHEWRAYRKEQDPVKQSDREQFWNTIASWFNERR